MDNWFNNNNIKITNANNIEISNIISNKNFWYFNTKTKYDKVIYNIKTLKKLDSHFLLRFSWFNYAISNY